MVQVVQKATGQSSGFDFLVWLGQNWAYFVLGILLIIAGIVIYYIIKKWDEERHERDDPVYETYKNYMRDCDLNKDPTKIRKRYKLVNLLWLGIPLVWSENSSRIVTFSGDTIGWYRGHSWSQDGYYILKVYMEKVFLFFESPFLIKVPWKIDFKVALRDKNGKERRDIDGRVMITKKSVDYSKFIETLSNGNIRLWCAGLQKMGYFRFPVFIDKDKNLIDLRSQLKDNIIETSADTMLSRVLSSGSMMVEKAMLHNPHVKYSQMSPEKTKVEVQETGGNEK